MAGRPGTPDKVAGRCPDGLAGRHVPMTKRLRTGESRSGNAGYHRTDRWAAFVPIRSVATPGRKHAFSYHVCSNRSFPILTGDISFRVETPIGSTACLGAFFLRATVGRHRCTNGNRQGVSSFISCLPPHSGISIGRVKFPALAKVWRLAANLGGTNVSTRRFLYRRNLRSWFPGGRVQLSCAW